VVKQMLVRNLNERERAGPKLTARGREVLSALRKKQVGGGAMLKNENRRLTRWRWMLAHCSLVLLAGIGLIVALPVMFNVTDDHHPAPKPLPKLVGNRAHIISPTFGCGTVVELSLADDLLRHGDRAAARSSLANCILLASKTADVTVEKVSLVNDAMCVRPTGRADCLWVRNSTVSADAR